jgi:hypothetical protein
MQRNHLLFIACFTFLLTSCSIEKRVYQSGYYISGKGSYKDAIGIKEKIKSPSRDENIFGLNNIEDKTQTPETIYLQTDSSELFLKTPVNTKTRLSDTATQIRIEVVENYSPSDTVPEEGQELLRLYEENNKLKKSFLNITYFFSSIVALGLLGGLVLLIVEVNGGISRVDFLIVQHYVLLCLSAILVAIPFFIIYLLLKIATKKQRRKLNKMGLNK